MRNSAISVDGGCVQEPQTRDDHECRILQMLEMFQ